jgi:hypothetical protein
VLARPLQNLKIPTFSFQSSKHCCARGNPGGSPIVEAFHGRKMARPLVQRTPVLVRALERVQAADGRSGPTQMRAEGAPVRARRRVLPTAAPAGGRPPAPAPPPAHTSTSRPRSCVSFILSSVACCAVPRLTPPNSTSLVACPLLRASRAAGARGRRGASACAGAARQHVQGALHAAMEPPRRSRCARVPRSSAAARARLLLMPLTVPDSLPPTPTHRVYSMPAWLRPGQGRYALMGHQPKPGTAPRPPRMRPSPSQLRRGGVRPGGG